MIKFYEDLQKYHNYTDYQIKVVKYTLKSFASEISKFIIILIFFLIIGKQMDFLLDTLLLLFFRRYNGGLHCKTYMACLITSFLYFFSCVLIFPSLIDLPYIPSIVAMIAMTIVLPFIAPIKSKYHAEVPHKRIIKYKIWTLVAMIFLTLLYIKFPLSSYMISAFWIVLLHVIQLTIAYIKKGRRCKE